MKISVLIPAFNEEKAIAKTVTALMKIDKVAQIIVVDDGSADKTAMLAEEAGAAVLKLRNNQGKGAALNYGAKYVVGDIICLVDGDLGESAQEVSKLAAPIINGESDIVIGTFPKKRRKAGFGLVKKLATWGIKTYTGQVFAEPLSGQRAFTQQGFKKILPFADGFGVEVFLTIKAIKNGLKVIEVETNMSHQETGRDVAGFCHRGKQFFQVLKALLLVKGLKI